MKRQIVELENSSQVELDKLRAKNRVIEDLKYEMDEMQRKQTKSNNIHFFIRFCLSVKYALIVNTVIINT